VHTFSFAPAQEERRHRTGRRCCCGCTPAGPTNHHMRVSSPSPTTLHIQISFHDARSSFLCLPPTQSPPSIRLQTLSPASSLPPSSSTHPSPTAVFRQKRAFTDLSGSRRSIARAHGTPHSRPSGSRRTFPTTAPSLELRASGSTQRTSLLRPCDHRVLADST
jgi:hypothetical protein